MSSTQKGIQKDELSRDDDDDAIPPNVMTLSLSLFLFLQLTTTTTTTTPLPSYSPHTKQSFPYLRANSSNTVVPSTLLW